MKYFRMNLYMALPENFTGSEDDAIRLYQKIRDDPPAIEGNPNISPRVAAGPFYQNLRYGAKIAAEVGIYYLDGRTWIRQNQNPDTPIFEGDVWVK